MQNDVGDEIMKKITYDDLQSAETRGLLGNTKNNPSVFHRIARDK